MITSCAWLCNMLIVRVLLADGMANWIGNIVHHLKHGRLIINNKVYLPITHSCRCCCSTPQWFDNDPNSCCFIRCWRCRSWTFPAQRSSYLLAWAWSCVAVGSSRFMSACCLWNSVALEIAYSAMLGFDLMSLFFRTFSCLVGSWCFATATETVLYCSAFAFVFGHS